VNNQAEKPPPGGAGGKNPSPIVPLGNSVQGQAEGDGGSIRQNTLKRFLKTAQVVEIVELHSPMVHRHMDCVYLQDHSRREMWKTRKGLQRKGSYYGA